MSISPSRHLFRHLSPEQMTGRARAYLIVGSLRYFLIGLAILTRTASALFHSSSPDQLHLFQIAPEWLWIASAFIGGVHLTYAAVSGSELHARTALVFSGAMSVMWAVGFGLIAMDGSASLLAAILFAAAAAKDFIVCSRPMRSPFEPLIRAQEEASGR
jgi:hypothetical protein